MRIYRCDGCGKVEDARYEGDVVKAPDGWFLLSRWGCTVDEERCFEFCAAPCAIGFLQERNR